MRYDENKKPDEAMTDEVTSEETGFKPYKVRVSVENLMLRQEPNGDPVTIGEISNRKVVTTGKGIFEISKEDSGFGYVERLHGWIKLEYTTKL